MGLEASYNGGQYRDGEQKTPDYLFLASSIMHAIGKHWQVVLNGENLLDYRQSSVEPLYFGSRNNPMFRPLWAPIDGRVINVSLKWSL
jgi:iron complex outermembrane receptor protein/outer membrane receptor for ferrienterochelin and colicins